MYIYSIGRSLIHFQDILNLKINRSIYLWKRNISKYWKESNTHWYITKYGWIWIEWSSKFDLIWVKLSSNSSQNCLNLTRLKGFKLKSSFNIMAKQKLIKTTLIRWIWSKWYRFNFFISNLFYTCEFNNSNTFKFWVQKYSILILEF